MINNATSINSKKKQRHSSKNSTTSNKPLNATNRYNNDLKSLSSTKKKIRYSKFKKQKRICTAEYCKRSVELRDKLRIKKMKKKGAKEQLNLGFNLQKENSKVASKN